MDAADEEALGRLKISQIIADIEQKNADAERKRQEVRLAPWALILAGGGAGVALFAAAAAFLRLLA